MNQHEQEFVKYMLTLNLPKFDERYSLSTHSFMHADTRLAYQIWCGGCLAGLKSVGSDLCL